MFATRVTSRTAGLVSARGSDDDRGRGDGVAALGSIMLSGGNDVTLEHRG
jgi:hypothetical protein